MFNKRVFIFPLLLIIVAFLLLFLNSDNQVQLADEKDREIKETIDLTNNDLPSETIIERKFSNETKINQELSLDEASLVESIEEVEMESMVEEKELDNSNQVIKKQMIVVEKGD